MASAEEKQKMHKEIPLRYDTAITADDRHCLNLFNEQFNPADIHLKEEGSSISILLKEVDVRELKKTISHLEKRTNGKSKRVLRDVLKSVEAIKSYGLSGKKRNFVGYNKERKVANRKAKESSRTPYYYAREHGFAAAENEFPKAHLDKIVQADSERFLKKLPDSCVDLVLTSPPYNFGLDYSGGGQSQDADYWEAYFEKLFAIFGECIRVLKFGGRIIVNVQPLYSDYIPSHHIISNFFVSKKMIWKGEIIWEKNNYNCKYTAWGSWKSPSNPYLKYTWEFLEIFCKGDLKKSGGRDSIDISAEEFKKWVVGKWSIAPERRMKEMGHPAMFPEQLAERALKLFSYKGDIVLDPFNGAGTTTFVARKFGRKYIGLDTSKAYCQIAKRRIGKVAA